MRRLHQQIGALLHIADLEVGQALADEGRHVEERPHRHVGDAERHYRGGVVVHHRHHLRPALVDLAVDEALAHRFAPLRIERPAVEVVLHQVCELHALGRDRARYEIAVRVARRAQAHVPVGVDHAVLSEDAVSRDEVFERFHQSALIPAAFTTRFQRASSIFTRRPRRSGLPPAAASPCLASTSLISACRRSWFSPAFTPSTTAPAVPAGANIAYQVSTSRSGKPCSLSVGTSAKAGERCALRTASMRSLPDCTCGATVCSAEIIACTWPPTRSAIAPPAPLYGTWMMSMPVSSFRNSMARC